jgi:hypothetical protein
VANSHDASLDLTRLLRLLTGNPRRVHTSPIHTTAMKPTVEDEMEEDFDAEEENKLINEVT